MSQEQTLESQTQVVTETTGSDDEAQALFEQRITPEEPEADPEVEPSESTEEEALDGEPEAEDNAEDKLETVEYEGKTYQVPPELQKALLRQSDYSRNMNEVGAQKKALTESIAVAENYVKGAEKYAEVLAEANSITAQLKSYEGVDWQTLRTDNPAEYAALAADKQTLLLAQTEIRNRAQNINKEISDSRLKLMQEKRSEMDKTLNKSLKGWGDELGTKITRYAVEQGYQMPEISEVVDARWVIAMDKARRYDLLQASKDTLKAKAKDAPVFVKPGATRQANPQGDAMARLKKDNSTESAEAAFLQRMK